MAKWPSTREAVIGLDVFDRMVELLPKLSDEEMHDMAKEGLAIGRSIAPVKSGWLRDHNYVGRPTKNLPYWRTVFRGYHAHLAEEGHMLVDGRTGTVHGFVPGTHFLARTFDTVTANVEERMANKAVNGLQSI